MNKEKLKQIIDDLKQVNLESELKIKDSELMDFAIRIYQSENIQDLQDNTKPSQKQISILKEFYTGNIEVLTRNESSQLIKEYFATKGKDKMKETQGDLLL